MRILTLKFIYHGGTMNYICELCGYVYKPELGDEENGIAPETDFEDLGEDWTCPLCGATKEDFEAVESDDYN
jgi:rubredoxin